MGTLLKKNCLVQLLAAFALVFLFREVVVWNNLIAAKYILTPLVTAACIAMVINALSCEGFNTYRLLILCGLIFALIADTLLMIVEVDLLQYGIIFFLAVHLTYISAFSRGYRFRRWNIALALVLLTAMGLFYSRVYGRTNGLDIAILVYISIISIMVFFAISQLGRSRSTRTVVLACAALLFMVSDLVLAINAFLVPLPHSSVWTWALYGPAQAMIALSTYDF